MDENELVLPEGNEIQTLSDEDLDAFEGAALSEIDTLFEGDNVTRESVDRAKYLADSVDRKRNESNRRVAERAELATERDATLARVRGEQVAAAGETEVLEGEVVTAGARPVGGAKTAHTALGGLAGPKRSLNEHMRKPGFGEQVDLTKAQSFAKVSDAPEREMSVLTASADIPGFTQGGQISSMSELVKAMHRRSRNLPVAHGNGQRVPVAQLQRKFARSIDQRMDLDEISALMEMATDLSVLTAAGGWCSPHEISYDFYNVVCIDGLVDLPTVGINRGGMSWPVSPSYGDISALPGVVWTWNNTQDVAAVTGTAQSGVKPCVRVPCPAYVDATLDCDGMCVTVGNLTSDAFPELIANHLRLVEAIHAHYMNIRLIQQLVAASNSTAVTLTGSDVPASWGLVNAAVFERRDLIEKYQMCDDAPMEAIYPRFALDMIRNDVAARANLNFSDGMCLSNAEIANWFDCNNIRAQFVADWQVRSTGQPGAATPPTAWPASGFQFLLFPVGTFVRGQGMTLDLGVVRDSVLNATNDFTAAWMEECWLLAKIGHESRLVTYDIAVRGGAGQAVSGNQL